MDAGADLLMFETTFDTLNLKAGIYAVEKLNDLYGHKDHSAFQPRKSPPSD